jgi:peptidoglycan/LPS O-acetylase OafA/YrhL
LAVLPVIFYHAGFGFPGGYVGVDVFFVISGYLITRLILAELDAGGFRLLNFWERRVRRLFPALAVVVLVTLAAGYFLLLPADYDSLAESALAQVLLVSNIHFWREIDYFAGPAELKPLLHTWSLAVEEQFYLIFPFLLAACAKFNRWPLKNLLGGLFGVSLLLSIWGSYANPAATFYLLPTRAWELLAGAGLSIMPAVANLHRRRMEWLGWLGLACVLTSVFCYGADTRFPGASALLPCLGACLIIHSNRGQITRVGRLLAWKPVVFIGMISYSLYLWHWPLLAMLRYGFGGNLSLEMRVLAVASSLLAASLTWKFVETPFRRRSWGSMQRVFVSAGAVTVLVMGTALAIRAAGGWPSRFSGNVIRLVTGNEIPKRFRGEGTIPLGVAPTQPREPSFLLWGDSHAQAIGELIDRLAIERGVSGYIAMKKAATPVVGTWRPNKGRSAVAWNQSVVEFVREKKIKHVILASRWSINIDGRPDGSTASLIVDESTPEASPAASQEVFRRGLLRTIAGLTDAGCRVWIMGQVPQQPDDVPMLLARSAHFQWHGQVVGTSLVQHRENQRNVARILAGMEGVRILEPARYCFDEQGRSLITGDGRSYYFDDNHLSAFGAERLLRAMFEPVFSEIERDSHSTAGSIKPTE